MAPTHWSPSIAWHRSHAAINTKQHFSEYDMNRISAATTVLAKAFYCISFTDFTFWSQSTAKKWWASSLAWNEGRASRKPNNKGFGFMYFNWPHTLTTTLQSLKLKTQGQCPLLAPSVHSPQMVWEYVCVCVDGMNLKYAVHWQIHISVHSILCWCYIQAFEDSEPTGLKVDIAKFNTCKAWPNIKSYLKLN